MILDNISRIFIRISALIWLCISVNTAFADQVPTATQTCVTPKIDAQGYALIACDISVIAPLMKLGEKLSLQYHIRPGFDVSLPATIPDAQKSDTIFSSAQDWQCVSQGAPQPPAHGCFLGAEALIAADGTSIFHTEILLRNPHYTRDIQSCFRIVGSGADRTLNCLPIEMNVPEAELSLEQHCDDVWFDGSFVNLKCRINVEGEHLLSETYVRILPTVLVGDAMVDARVLGYSSDSTWECEDGRCTIDSDDLIAIGGHSRLQLSRRISEPHVNTPIYACVQVTTRTPRLASDRTCVELSR